MPVWVVVFVMNSRKLWSLLDNFLKEIVFVLI